MPVATRLRSDILRPVDPLQHAKVGDVKKRLEKMHGFAFNLQRLLHLGRVSGRRMGNSGSSRPTCSASMVYLLKTRWELPLLLWR